MTVRLINFAYKDIFLHYSKKYNIYRDLYIKDLFGLEIKNSETQVTLQIRKIYLKNNLLCYLFNQGDSNKTDLLIIGTLSLLNEISKDILSEGDEGIGLLIQRTIDNYLNYDNNSFVIGNKNFDFNSPYVMGILNVTPDSFSDGGKFYDKNKAVEHGIKLLKEGADILDIGGESTRPNAEQISVDEELKRVIPVLEDIKKQMPEAIISVDTTKSDVAFEALKRGAEIINDISGLTFDKQMLNVVKDFNASLVIMHIKGTPKIMQINPVYDETISDIYKFLYKQTLLAKEQGIKNIFIDPGIGFGKRIFDNYELIKRLDEFKCIGQPILIGLSRKSFIGKALNLDVGQRDNATAAAEVVAIKNGAKVIRTHNVKFGVQIKKIVNYIENPKLAANV